MQAMTFRAEHWSLSKPVLRSRHGLVAAQEAEAAAQGAAVLRAGGNAVDAAVVTALCLATTEPWMSGIGGGGVMLIHLAAERRTDRHRLFDDRAGRARSCPLPPQR